MNYTYIFITIVIITNFVIKIYIKHLKTKTQCAKMSYSLLDLLIYIACKQIAAEYIKHNHMNVRIC